MSDTDVHVQRMPPVEQLEEHRDSVQVKSSGKQGVADQANLALEEQFGGNPFEDIDPVEFVHSLSSHKFTRPSKKIQAPNS